MRDMKRLVRLLRWFATTVVVLVSCAATAVIVIETDWFKDRLRGIAATQAARFLNGELRIGRISGSLFKGVLLEDVTLVQEGVTVLAASRIRVRYDPFAFARRDFILDDVVVERAVVNAIENGDGWNLARLIKPREGPRGRPIRFAIRDLRLADTTATIAPRHTASHRLTGVALESALTLEPEGVALDIHRLSAIHDRSGYTIRELAGRLDRGFRRFDIEFAAEAAAARLGGHASGVWIEGTRQIDAELHLVNVDASAFLEDDRWVTDLTGAATVRTTMAGGPRQSPVVAFTFDGSRAAALGYEARRLRAKGEWTRAGVTFDAEALAYGTDVRMKGAWRAASGNRPAGLSGAGRFARADLRRLPRRLQIPPLASRLAGSFVVRTSGQAWSADVELAESTVEGATVAAGTIGHVEIDGAHVRYAGTGRVTGLDVQRLAGPLDVPALAAPRYRSRLAGAFYIGGRGRDADTRLIVGGATLFDSELSGANLPVMSASMTLTGRRLAIDAHGIFEHLDGDTLGLPPDAAADLTGVVNGLFVLKNIDQPFRLEAIDADAQVVLQPSRLYGVDVQRALVEGQLLDGLITVREATAESADGRAHASGVLALGATGQSSLAVTADTDDLSVAGSRLGRPVAGTAHVEATITGPPDALVAAGTLQASQLKYGDRISALTLNSTFTAKVDEQQFDQIAVSAETAGTFVKLGDVELLRLAATSKYQSRQLDVDARLEDQARTLTVAGGVAFQPEAHEMQVRTLNLVAGPTTWRLPEGSPAVIRYGTDRLSIEGLSLAGATGRIDVAGTLALAPGAVTAEDTGVSLAMKDVPVADLNGLLMGTRRLEGLVNGTVTMRGTPSSPDVRAALTITNGTVEGVAYESLAGKVDYRDGQATIDMTLTQTAANTLTAKGTIPIAAGDDASGSGMNVKIQSEGIELALAQLFTSELTAVTGTGQFDLTLTGPAKRPEINGTVVLAGGGFDVSATGARYHELAARLRFDRSRLQIDELHMLDRDGHPLTAEGGVDVFAGATGRTVDVRIHADEFRLLDNDFGDIGVDIDLRATGTLTAPKIDGTLRVSHGSLEVGRILETTTSDAYRSGTEPANGSGSNGAAPAQAPSSGGLFSQAELALQVLMPDNLVLRGRDMRVGAAGVGAGDMNVIAGGSFDIAKPAGGGVRVLGVVEIVRGYYTFQGRRFEVERGSTVRFRGDRPPNPTLGITAEREISGVTAQVAIAGTVSQPRLTLSSRPPLDESDILSLIVFNRPVNDLGGMERVSLAERAGSLAAGALAAPIADSVARALNLDVFEIQTTSGAGLGPSVALGSQIGTRLYVGIKQEFGRSEASSVSLEYRVNRLLRVVTSLAYSAVQTQAARRTDGSGIDLIFVVRY
jgi:autotransporter translocation and assembly factor TamB